MDWERLRKKRKNFHSRSVTWIARKWAWSKVNVAVQHRIAAEEKRLMNNWRKRTCRRSCWLSETLACAYKKSERAAKTLTPTVDMRIEWLLFFFRVLENVSSCAVRLLCRCSCRLVYGLWFIQPKFFLTVLLNILRHPKKMSSFLKYI